MELERYTVIMFNISLNNNLASLIENKRVVMIGPSPHLTGSKLGNYIDRHDTVCRINDVMPPPDLRGDYGSRTDILFHNFGTVWMEGLREKISYGDTQSHWDNLKLVICPSLKATGEDADYLSWPDDYVSSVVRNFELINDSKLPFYWIGVRDYKTLWSKVGVEPNAGFLSIMILLSYPIKELFVTGYSFYKQGTQERQVYRKGHWPKCYASNKDFGLGHNQQAQLNLFKSMCNIDSRIIVDSYMNKLLDLDHERLIRIEGA